jgi:hypothetical protein
MPELSDFGFFLDAAGLQPVPLPLDYLFSSSGVTAPHQTQLFFGSNDNTVKLTFKPGTTPPYLELQIVDTDPSGPHLTTDIKLASTQQDLATATPGASFLLVAGDFFGGSPLIPFWVEVSNPHLVLGYTTELRLMTNEVEAVEQSGGPGVPGGGGF